MKTKDLSIKIPIGNEIRDFEEVQIDRANLSNELAEQPAWYAYYASLQVEAASFYDQAKGEYEKMLAEVASELRSDYKKKGIKYTEKQIESEVTIDPRIQGMRRKVVDLRRRADVLKVATKAFEQRLQALMSICAMERVQMQNIEPSFRSNDPTSHAHSSSGQDVSVPARKEYLAELEEIRQRHQEQEEAMEMIGGKAR